MNANIYAGIANTPGTPSEHPMNRDFKTGSGFLQKKTKANPAPEVPHIFASQISKLSTQL